jgi:hypothetical protein
MTVLYYALGGGLGHLTRARAFLYSIGCQCEAVILTASEFAGDRRVVGNIPVLQAPLTRPEFDRIILDTFPAGLFGELQSVQCDYVARYLRWDKYKASLPENPPRFDCTYILEPLDSEHERWIMERSREVIRDLVLIDPPAAVAQTFPSAPSYVLIVHSGPAEEIEELIAYAREVCSAEEVHDPMVLAAPSTVHVADVLCVDVYPATLLAPRATRIFTGGGYNAMRQFGGDLRHRPLPFPRRFDDQYQRVARLKRVPQRRGAVAVAAIG